MKAVWITRYGGPKVLTLRETADPIPQAGELRIQVRAAGLNFSETSARQGIYPAAPKPPCVVGYEGAGVVDGIGPNVDQQWLGQRVMFLSRFGGHASVVSVPELQVVAIPDALSFETAAALPVVYLTAHHILFAARRLAPGDRVLVHAAAGGVGTALLQLCRTVPDVTVIGMASRSKHGYLKEHGATQTIDYHNEDYVEVVRRLYPDGVDLICNARGGASWSKDYTLLAPAGMLVCFGLAAAQKPGKRRLSHVALQVLLSPRFGALKLMNDNRSVAGVDLGMLWDRTGSLTPGLERLLSLWQSGSIAPHIDAIFPFENAADAHARLEQAENTGKILLTP